MAFHSLRLSASASDNSSSSENDSASDEPRRSLATNSQRAKYRSSLNSAMRIRCDFVASKAPPSAERSAAVDTVMSAKAGAARNAPSKYRAMVLLAAFAAATLVVAAPEPSSTAPAPKAPSQIVADALIRLQAHLDVAGHAMGEDQAEALGSRLAD